LTERDLNLIISHKHKFIFIKTKKTAGTSIEILLSKYCGDDDIITPISPEDEKIRRGLGYKTAQNYQYLDNNKEIKFYNHINATEIKKFIGDEVWDSYYKFCFERNPWEKVISFYYWVHKEEPRPSISTFIRSKKMEKLFYGEHTLYTIDNTMAVDQVYLYENINKSLQDILAKLHIKDQDFTLPRAKSRFREDKRDYHHILNHQDITYISELFSLEINMFYTHSH